MKKIYTHENRMIVWDVKNVLEAEGFQCIVKNEYAAGAMGDLSPIDVWPELWLCEDCQYEAATRLLKAKYEYPPPRSEWICQSCHEKNIGSFELCWNCGDNDPALSKACP